MAFTVSVKRVSFVVTALGCGIFGSVDWSQDNGLAQSIQSEEINRLTVSRRNLVKQLDEVRLPGMRSTSRKRAPELPSARMRDRFGEIKLMREAV